MKGHSCRITRRDLLAKTSQAAAGMLGVPAVVSSSEPATQPAASRPAKILNYNSRMKYRHLGKTGLVVSEVSLGGHWKDRNAKGYWADFANDEVPEEVATNRSDVISACIEAGINYVDSITAGECLAYGAALKGRRDRMQIGADDHRLCIRAKENVNEPTQTRNIEECLRRLKTDYVDLWRVQARQSGAHPLKDLEPAIAAAEKAVKAGKVRHFGVSSHNRSWLQQVIEAYPQVEVVIFPVTAGTREKGLPVTKENVVEVEQPFQNAKDRSTSIFETVRKHDVGLLTIKPFAGGSIFSGTSRSTFPVLGVGSKTENDLARLTLQCILARYDEISAVIPGLTTVYEVDNAVRASHQREAAMLPADEQWLNEVTQQRLAALPEQYQWLHEWSVI